MFKFKSILKAGLSGVAVAAVMASGVALAADWPTKPVTIVVPNGPGGGTDIVARIVGEALGKVLGQPFVVENQPGAGTTLGAGAVARANADGYTALMMSNGFATAAAMYEQLPYDPIADFEMVSQVGAVSLAVVTGPQFHFDSVQDMIAELKANPGKYNFASVGAGATQHLAAELFVSQAGVDIVHVPYNSTPTVLAALLSNEAQLTFELVPAIQGQIADDGIQALAVTSPDRAASLPDVPTLKESGLPDYSVTSWYGLSMPAGTDAAILDKFNAAVVEVLADPDVAKRISETGIIPVSSSRDEYTAHVASEVAKWVSVVEEANIPKN